jgi:hypothetical protein
MLEVKDIELVNLMEARKNPELNPKISAYEALKPYSKDDNYYISFTAIDKIGINPKSPYDTPLGIYAYPLKAIWKEYFVDMLRSVGKSVPFAGNSPYVWLIKVKNNVNFVKDMYTDYTSKDYDTDIKTLKNHILSNQDEYKKLLKDDNGNLDTISGTIDLYFTKWTKEAKARNAVMSMWNITRNLATYREGKPPVQWSYLLHRVLGYGGFGDNSGRGYIHPSEPIQAVFFSTRSFDVVAEFLNKDYDTSVYWYPIGLKSGKIKIKNADTAFEKDEDTNETILVWNDGVWVDGEWIIGRWEFGTWKNGIWHGGRWEGGTWEKGDWYSGAWLDGTWENGFWMDGFWQTGIWKNGIWSTGTWLNGTWYNGQWGGGEWYKGSWFDGIWEDGTWKDGTWHNGVWKRGDWSDGLWVKGTWENGTWLDGIWKDGNGK